MPVRDSVLIDTEVEEGLVLGSVLEGCKVRRAAVVGTVARGERFRETVVVGGREVGGRVVTVPVRAGAWGAASGEEEARVPEGDGDVLAIVADAGAMGLLRDLLRLEPRRVGLHALFTFSGPLPGRLRRRIVGNLDVFRECCPCAYLRLGDTVLAFRGGRQVFGEPEEVRYRDVLVVRDGRPTLSAWRPAARSVISELGAG
ncbi:MAG: hypothetical protein ABGY09_03875 [Euryarchaeota archaeon]